jgi:hypothetical protein
MMKRNQEAAESLERALVNDSSDFIKQSTYYELVRVYRKLNRKEDSRYALQELTRLKAQSSRADSNRE